MRNSVHDDVALETQISRLGDRERRILSKILRRKPIARDVVAEYQERLSFGDRLADRIASFGGSWAFIAIFLTTMACWMLYNADRPGGFDPYPFILLNLVLSCLAALQAPIIMMSQNRMSAKDRIDARHDYEVNLKAELEIESLHLKLDELHLRQLEAIERVERLLSERAAR
jgi:uncharacterized membrane protein